jgi:hypothetical protein
MMRNSLLLLISLAGGVQAAPPAHVEISYAMMRNGSVIAETVQRLEHGDGKYRLTEVWKGKGLYALAGSVKRGSHGIVTAEGLKPLEFRDERSGRATAMARFDWQARTLTLQYKGASRTETLPPHAHDRLAFFFNFAFAPPRTMPVTLDLADGRGLSRHVYEVNGRERLKTPAGEFDAVRIVRKQDQGRTAIWLAADRNVLPVRVLLVDEDGSRLEQIVTGISAQ